MLNDGMKKACAWCGVHVDGDVKAKKISHTICPVCRAGLKKTDGDDINEFDHPGFWEFGLPHDYADKGK